MTMKQNIHKLLGRVVLVVVGGLIGLTAGIYQQNRDFREAATRNEIKDLRQHVLSLEFVKDEIEQNVRLLENKHKLVPKIRVLTMENNKEELVKEDPLLALLGLLNEKFQDEMKEASAFLASQDAKKPKNQGQVDDVKELLEVAKVVETVLNRCIKKVKYDYLPQERFQLNFLYRATRNRILMSLPKPYAMTLNRMYNDLWKVNDRLRQIEEVKKEGRTSFGLLHVLYSLPSDIPKLRHLEVELTSLLTKLQVQEFHQFKNQTDLLIKAFEKRLMELE